MNSLQSSHDSLCDRVWLSHAYLGPLLVAIVALLAVVMTLDAAGTYPALGEGPGITLDESFNVQMGVYQVRAWQIYNLALLHPDTARDAFGPETSYNPDHPPLGRLWLGVCHELTKWIAPPAGHPPPDDRFITVCARVGSATAFALTVFLVGWFTTKWHGRAAGIVAAVSLVLMPRVFAHAHIASLETFMNLTYSAAILAVGHWWSKSLPAEGGNLRCGWLGIPWQVATLTGVLFGLALLSKMQAILISPVVGLWALWHWRARAVAPLILFGVVGLLVFIVGWPWLWIDLTKNLREYFARTTSRAVLNCFYLSRVWPDKDVPWHYPFAMFAFTVPVGLHLLGLCGTRTSLRDPRCSLVLLATLLPLVLFAIPSVAVYDGERLFLVSFPMWAVLIGRGVATLIATSEGEANAWRFGLTSSQSRMAVLTMLLVAQSFGVIVTHPCQLSYYNLLIGGSAGAERLGFERTYWGDSLTRSFWRQMVREIPAGSSVRVSPVLHQFQLPELINQSPILREHGIQIDGGEIRDIDQAEPHPVAEILFARKADLKTEMFAAGYPSDATAPVVGNRSRWLAIMRPIKR